MPNTERMRAWLCAAVNDVVGVEVGMRSIVTAATYPGRMDDKATLKTYLDSLRSAILWKLEGLDEWQLRWPMTSTGSNLLGIVKHLAAMEYGYLGHVFDRPGEELPWMGQDAEPNADLWATSDETVESVVRLYRRAVAHADETIASLDLDAAGHVPWWPQPDVTLHRVLVHLSVEVARHAGQVDVLRELLATPVLALTGRRRILAWDGVGDHHRDQVHDAAVEHLGDDVSDELFVGRFGGS